MTSSVQRIHLGSNSSPIDQGRSTHGRWRTAFQPATPPEPLAAQPAVLTMIQDADRLTFALAEGAAADLLAERLADHLWTVEAAGPDWPVELRAWLAETERWADAPPGRAGFVCGRLERSIAGGRIYLAWLGANGVRLLDRTGGQVTLDLALEDGEGWTPEHGPEPVGMGLHAYRGSLFGLDRLLVFSSGAAPVGPDLPDLANGELQQALEDWGSEAEHDLAVFDLRLTPILTQPSSVIVSYRWISSELCLLSWHPAPNVTGYRVEESAAPTFEQSSLVAELTDGRQTQYRFSPPAGTARYYRVVPLNQGVPGTPSEASQPVPVVLTPPIMEPISWSDDGGFRLRWTAIVQATGYEVQTAPDGDFDGRDTEIVYRGAGNEAYLPAITPPGRYYRVRAINVLYAPTTPSPWSQAARAPNRLATPVFTRVTQQRLEWTPVAGARHYAVHITPKGLDEGQGEDIVTLDPVSGVADQYATYRVRAFRQPDDRRTASDWSDPVTVAPPISESSLRDSAARWTLPALIGTALLALVVGGALGLFGLRAYQDAHATATRTPLPTELVQATFDAATQNAANATAIAVTAQFVTGQTATAALWTPTPTATATDTPSATPNLTETVAAALSANLTATAAQWTATPSPTATLTPSTTPNLTETVAAAFQANLTATAARWTATPSPTVTLTPSATPNLTETVAAAFRANLTATAALWTDTPTATATLTPSATPNVTQTVAAAFRANLTATAARWTLTPTATVTLTPSATPNLTATVGAAFASQLTATAAQWTPTPTATATFTPSVTPNMTATIDALIAAHLTSGCFLVRLPDDPLPLMSGPYTGDTLLLSMVPHLAEVTGRQVLPGDPPQVWLRVQVTTVDGLLDGWLRVPDGTDELHLYAGPDCPVVP